jgi:hypothetical protein
VFSPVRYVLLVNHSADLDKYGLVNRFSRILEENGLNHMYSSTFKTANLLVRFIRIVHGHLHT